MLEFSLEDEMIKQLEHELEVEFMKFRQLLLAKKEVFTKDGRKLEVRVTQTTME